MIRRALLSLATSKQLQAVAQGTSILVRPVRRFVAGTDSLAALAAAERLAERGVLTTLDYLGENADSAGAADRTRLEYESLVMAAQERRLRVQLSVKLTALGLDLEDDLCERSLSAIAAAAKKADATVRIDMESSGYVDRTLSMYHRVNAVHGNLGVVIQAYLRRSKEDVRRLCATGASVRLCKGAYREPPLVAFPRKRDTDANYAELMKTLIDATQTTGVRLALATHDPRLIRLAKDLLGAKRSPGVEFEMLYGIRTDIQEQLIAEDYPVRVYVPYGTRWYPYFMRRLAERPANLWFLLRNLAR